ncbi:MAG: divergent polysaccharide deacetylase family protein [Candidatus Eremiobacteraeota bacterium]|nr:divergent polysaccharide deacetylase family protein [Candidatus Eremiobacteraeota bacterium]
MPKKKRRTKNTGSVLPLLLIAAVVGAAIVWAILPRSYRHSTHRVSTETVSAVTPVPERSEAPTTASPPEATPTVNAIETPKIVKPVGRGHGEAGPQVAIIIDDCGQWLETERGVIGLPIPVTLAVLPHVHYSKLISQEASHAGKGVMLHLPMEPVSHANPGPGEIKTDMTDDAIVAQAEDDIAQVPLAKGVNNHEGSEASADERVMRDVIGVIKDHGLFFVDSMTSSKSVGYSIAQADGVPNASRDVFLDDQADVAYTEKQLQHAMELAQKNGSAIAIGHPKPTTLEAIKAMYPQMQAAGVEFVLASDLVH